MGKILVRQAVWSEPVCIPKFPYKWDFTGNFEQLSRFGSTKRQQICGWRKLIPVSACREFALQKRDLIRHH